MINAKHYSKFVKVNGLLSPASKIQLQKLQVSSPFVSAALSRRRRVTPPHVYHRDAPLEIHESAWAVSFSYGTRLLTPLPQHPSCGFPKKYPKTASVTQAWQSVITGALYCVFTPKVVQVSICLSARQRCTHRQHIQAVSLVNVSSALTCLTEKEHFFPPAAVSDLIFSLCCISSFFPPLPIVLKSPFIFKLAPSKVLLSGDC